MKALENRTVDPKRKMDILDALHDIRARNSKNERVGQLLKLTQRLHTRLCALAAKLLPVPRTGDLDSRDQAGRLRQHGSGSAEHYVIYPSRAPCLYTSGPIWEVRKGLEEQGIIREPRTVCRPDVVPVWVSMMELETDEEHTRARGASQR